MTDQLESKVKYQAEKIKKLEHEILDLKQTQELIMENFDKLMAGIGAEIVRQNPKENDDTV